MSLKKTQEEQLWRQEEDRKELGTKVKTIKSFKKTEL